MFSCDGLAICFTLWMTLRNILTKRKLSTSVQHFFIEYKCFLWCPMWCKNISFFCCCCFLSYVTISMVIYVPPIWIQKDMWCYVPCFMCASYFSWKSSRPGLSMILISSTPDILLMVIYINILDHSYIGK